MVKRIECKEARKVNKTNESDQARSGVRVGDYDMDGMWRMETMEEEWNWRVRPMS